MKSRRPAYADEALDGDEAVLCDGNLITATGQFACAILGRLGVDATARA